MKKPKRKTKPIFVYVLELSGDRYYVGLSKNPDQRIKEHFAGQGSSWTKRHRPIEVIKIIETNARTWRRALEIETHLTLELMRVFGWRNVRGGPFTARDLVSEPRSLMQQCPRLGVP
ncbi:GIY-YIG nuclease family protein [Pseudomonas nicosulfuronedens]